MNEQEIRADERAKVAYRINAELVCCDIYDQLEAIGRALAPSVLNTVTPRDLADMYGLHFHHLCYYGAWAAAIVLASDQGCDSQGCAPNYWCPTAGEYESPCHGGFDTCCSHPELHREKE